MPTVSIAIPAYNCGRYIGQTLDSVLAQTYTDWECIIVDDASTDDTAAVVQAYVDRDDRFRLHRVDPNTKSPPPASRNIALSLCTGKWYVPLDGDDWWEPWKLERQIQAMYERPGIVLCCCSAWIWQNDKVTTRSSQINKDTIGRDLLTTCMTIYSVMADRQAVVALGGYDPNLVLAEDWDLWARMTLKHGFENVTAITEPCMYYRRHGENITSDTRRNIRYDRMVVRKLLFKMGLLRSHPKLAMKLVDSQIVREMDNHIRGGRKLKARFNSMLIIAVNPLKSWRWQYAKRAWKMPVAQEPAKQS